MNFTIDGHVSVCCLNRVTSVPINGRPLLDIWNGPEFQKLRTHVTEGDLSYDCGVCKAQLDAGNMAGLKANDYRKFAPVHGKFPKVMEFCLDNTCNLACSMCNSVLSSTIRKERGLPPHRRLYDDSFVKELEPFIPHLQEAVFSGGEPFLIPLYYSIWDLMSELNPDLVISVVTNGTVLNDRVMKVLERGRFHINVSMESVDRQTYSTIRKRADLAQVMDNFLWFREYGERKGRRVNIPVCLLTQNWTELPSMVDFANRHQVTINFVHVDRPFRLALLYQDRDYLAEAVSQLEIHTFVANDPVAESNVERYKGLLEELRSRRDAKSDGIAGHDKRADDPAFVGIPEQMLPVIDRIPEADRERLTAFLNTFPKDRLLQFVEGKPVDEAANMLREFLE